MDRNEILWTMLFGAMIGLMIGILTVGFYNSTKAYVSQEGRVCIEGRGPDVCISRVVGAEEGKRIADAINGAMGREWWGLP